MLWRALLSVKCVCVCVFVLADDRAPHYYVIEIKSKRQTTQCERFYVLYSWKVLPCTASDYSKLLGTHAADALPPTQMHKHINVSTDRRSYLNQAGRIHYAHRIASDQHNVGDHIERGAAQERPLPANDVGQRSGNEGCCNGQCRLIELYGTQSWAIRSHVPINAASASSDPIQANSSVVGTAGSGESVSAGSFSLGEIGEVQPSVVPTAKLDRLAVCGQLFESNWLYCVTIVSV